MQIIVVSSEISNNAPLLDIIGSKILGEGEKLEFQVSASDAEG